MNDHLLVKIHPPYEHVSVDDGDGRHVRRVRPQRPGLRRVPRLLDGGRGDGE